MYPPVQAHASGWLPTRDGHRVHWEECGNPLGVPALFVHGGPGAGCTADDRRWFDPQRFRIVLFDQRGTGRSLPLGRTASNRTADLVDDMERLRVLLEVQRWVLFGGSWGATLALAYGQRHPARVRAMVLRGVFLASPRERRWLYGSAGAALHHPSAWRRFHAGEVALLKTFAVRLRSSVPGVRAAATDRWLRWEQELMPGAAEPRVDAKSLAMARIGVHYTRHRFFVDAQRLLARMHRLVDVPGVLLQGDSDAVTPGFAAESLHRGWPGSVLHRLPGTGHASTEPAMAKALIEATDTFADQFAVPAFRKDGCSPPPR